MPGPDGSRPLFLQYAAEAFDVAARYAATFGLAVDFDGRAEIDAALTTWRDRWARYSTPQAARKRAKATEYRERARERKEAAERERERQLWAEVFARWKAGLVTARPGSWHYDEGSPEHGELLALERAEREQAAREAAEAFRLWQAGEAPRPGSWRYQTGSPERAAIEAEVTREQARAGSGNAGRMAARASRSASMAAMRRAEPCFACAATRRISRQGSTRHVRRLYLETSLGATVPLADAVKAFRFCRLVWARGEAGDAMARPFASGISRSTASMARLAT